MLDRVFRLLFPPKCVLCGKVLEDDQTDLCTLCRVDGPDCSGRPGKLSFLDSWSAVWYYEGNARRSILRYKFYGARGNAAAYGRLLAMKLSREYPDGFDLLTWVPTGWLRRLFRGYDQVELLAYAVGAELEMEPVQLLKKQRNTKPQSRITGEAQRRANVLGAYEVCGAEELKGKRILLLDDVITTGATAGECARVLLTAGAKEVHCGAVARARHHGKRSR